MTKRTKKKMQSTRDDPVYILKDVEGKGKGLVAIEAIPKVTRILSEEPVITVPRGSPDSERVRAYICQQVDVLNQEQREAFLSMHNIHAYNNVAEQCLGIVRTNALPIEADGGDEGIFLEACRINHACDNNAQKSWNVNTKRHTVHTLRDISKGEEITIYYLRIHNIRKTRQETLQERFGFFCGCRLCSLPLELSQESDKRLEKIILLNRLIGGGGVEGLVSNPARTLRFVDQQVRLYNEHTPFDAGLPRAFFDAAQIAITNGDLARGRTFMERAVAGWRVLEGNDGERVLQFGPLAKDPSKYEPHGLSMK